MASERGWHRSAKTPPAWTTNPGVATREDLFNELEILRRRVTEKDGMMDSAIRASLTRCRALAATLIPKRDTHVCGVGGCTIGRPSESAIRRHQLVVHGVSSDQAGRVAGPEGPAGA